MAWYSLSVGELLNSLLLLLAEFKALGKKIKLEFEIAKEITDFLVKHILEE